MFSDLVATWFVFLRSCLNSSFPASRGRNRKEISSLRGEKSKSIRGEWRFLSVIHMSSVYVCLHVFVFLLVYVVYLNRL